MTFNVPYLLNLRWFYYDRGVLTADLLSAFGDGPYFYYL
jgi:hypothetical protein